MVGNVQLTLYEIEHFGQVSDMSIHEGFQPKYQAPIVLYKKKGYVLGLQQPSSNYSDVLINRHRISKNRHILMESV